MNQTQTNNLVQEFSNFEELKQSVKAGHVVKWGSEMYRVIYRPSIDEFYISCSHGGRLIGLYEPDFKIQDFYTQNA